MFVKFDAGNSTGKVVIERAPVSVGLGPERRVQFLSQLERRRGEHRGRHDCHEQDAVAVAVHRTLLLFLDQWTHKAVHVVFTFDCLQQTAMDQGMYMSMADPQHGDQHTSMTDILLTPLDKLQKLSQTLFLSLGPAQSKPPPPPGIFEFQEVDHALNSALQLARVHQINQGRIEELKSEVLGLEARLREVWSELEQGKRDLEEIIEEGDVRLKAIEKAKAGRSSAPHSVDSPIPNCFTAAIPYPELLAYAQSLSAFTSAPPHTPDLNIPGQPPPPLFFPPFPNEEKMRRGRLNAEAPLGPLGETHSVGRRMSSFPSLFIF